MTVRLGDVTFADWASLEYEGGYTDTFVFQIDALNGLPPFGYRPLLQQLAAQLNKNRRGASLWIQVDSPGEWYLMEVKRSLSRELKVPHAITPTGQIPAWTTFTRRPDLWHFKCMGPPVMEANPEIVSQDELKCMRALARIQEGLVFEIASLSGVDEAVAANAIESLRVKKLIQPAPDPENPIADVRYWQLSRNGLSHTMRNWGVPAKVGFTDRREGDPKHARTPHRHVSRMWLAWLRKAYPNTQIWTGWSEVFIPAISVHPDALVWGRVQGFESLFWLEVGDQHKGSGKIEEITQKRLVQALEFCRRTGARLVYAQLSPNWVQKAALWGFANLPGDAAVILGSHRRFGKLPMVEWGKVMKIT